MIRQTIYSALCAKLGRIPTNSEIKAECKRIISEAVQSAASRGKLSFQRK